LIYDPILYGGLSSDIVKNTGKKLLSKMNPKGFANIKSFLPKNMKSLKNKFTKENLNNLRSKVNKLGSTFKNQFSRKKKGEGLNADNTNATNGNTENVDHKSETKGPDENASFSKGHDGLDNMRQGVFNRIGDYVQSSVQNKFGISSKSAPPRENANANANPNSGKRNATNYDVSLDNGNVKVCVTNGRCAYYKVEPVNSQSNT
jgi:hypothetical protein